MVAVTSSNPEMESSVVVASPLSQSPMGLDVIFEKFLDSHDVSASSRGTYRRQLKQFSVWLQLTDRLSSLSALKRDSILAYKTWLHDSGKSAHSVGGYLVAVRRLFSWLESEKIYPNIARDIKGPKKPKGFRKDCLTISQIKSALASLQGSDIEQVRDYALVNLLVRTGLRTIEVSGATVGDLRQESGEAVLWIKGKGRDSKDDFVLLMEEALVPIRKYLASRGPLSENAPLFASLSDKNLGEAMCTRSISRIVKETFKSIGLDDRRLTAHSLRHTAVTLAIKGGASLQQAQAMARHTDPKTTMIYFHNLDRVKSGAERFIQI